MLDSTNLGEVLKITTLQQVSMLEVGRNMKKQQVEQEALVAQEIHLMYYLQKVIWIYHYCQIHFQLVILFSVF